MATSLEFTAGPSDLWPVSWLHLGGPSDFKITQTATSQVCKQLRRRGLVGEFVSIYEDEGIACSVRIRGSCWKKSRCRMGKTDASAEKNSLDWVDLPEAGMQFLWHQIEGRLCRPVIIVADGMPQFIPEKHVPLEPCPVSEWRIFFSLKVHLHDPCWLVAKDVETTEEGGMSFARLLAARCGWMGSLAWNVAFWMRMMEGTHRFQSYQILEDPRSI